VKKWNVTGTVTGSKYLGVFEAETKEEAEALALESESALVAICNYCNSECSDPSIESAVAAEIE